MGLKHRINVLYWRARYWWMDTDDGQQTHVAMLCTAVLIGILQIIKMGIAAAMPAHAPAPEKAWIWWVVQLIIAIVAAIASYALAPKMEAAPAKQQDMPTVNDGQVVLEVHGDCWIDEEFIMAQQVVGKEPIKSKGKK